MELFVVAFLLKKKMCVLMYARLVLSCTIIFWAVWSPEIPAPGFNLVKTKILLYVTHFTTFLIFQQGKLDLYNTGIFLRDRYGKFLGTHYSPDIYYTQSTDVDRTKASVQLVNAGLWPPQGDQKWGSLDWQPIPVHSEPLAQDNVSLQYRQININNKKI